jgi:hypothetical protein
LEQYRIGWNRFTDSIPMKLLDYLNGADRLEPIEFRRGHTIHRRVAASPSCLT